MTSATNNSKRFQPSRLGCPGMVCHHCRVSSALYHYGLKELEYYTVLFSVSRAMGMCSQMILNRALGVPITRPKSVGTKFLKDFIAAN